MEWAKAECARNILKTSSINLRVQLGELFNRIPFCKPNIEEFTTHITVCKGFFTVDELECNIEQIVAQKRFYRDSNHNPQKKFHTKRIRIRCIDL